MRWLESAAPDGHADAARYLARVGCAAERDGEAPRFEERKCGAIGSVFERRRQLGVHPGTLHQKVGAGKGSWIATYDGGCKLHGLSDRGSLWRFGDDHANALRRRGSGRSG